MDVLDDETIDKLMLETTKEEIDAIASVENSSDSKTESSNTSPSSD